MLLLLAGIPLTAGFLGKFYVITAGVDAHLWWPLGGVAAVGSAIGLYYYLRLMVSLFLLDPSKHRFSAKLDWAQRSGGTAGCWRYPDAGAWPVSAAVRAAAADRDADSRLKPRHNRPARLRPAKARPFLCAMHSHQIPVL